MQKVIVALLLGAAAALAPSARASPKLDRRAALQQSLGVVAGALALPQVASADGAVSTATVQRSRGIYGGRIAALKDAVAKGDFAAVADEKNAFLLFNSGAYTQKNPQIKAAKAATVAAYDDVASARGPAAPAAPPETLEPRVEMNTIASKPTERTRKGELKKLQRELRKEHRGAVRELRRDAAFLRAERGKRSADAKRDKTDERQRNFAWLQTQAQNGWSGDN
mmetsp:Transcript_24273/g.73028  ORF Transcript_24273/g.73028 Transcript_24273/m.73028 type:complete len:224 (+) Transcript_24273:177-848(+)